MHELSIALSLVDLACDKMLELGSIRVTSVHLRLGPLSGVVKEALLFSFEAATQGTPIEGARLLIEDVPVTVWCPTCSAERLLDDVRRRRCPVCSTVTPELVRGDDLEFVSMEMVDA